MTARWSEPSATATIDCNGERHQLRWADGALHALDHGDAEGERVLTALGGKRCACVDALETWARHDDDLLLLALGPRSRADRLQPSEQLQQRLSSAHSMAAGGGSQPRSFLMTSGRTYAMPAPGPTPAPERDPDDVFGVVTLLLADSALAHCLVASVAATWATRLADHDSRVESVRPRLAAALHGRVGAAVREWLGDASVGLEMSTATAGVRRRADTVELTLPFRWLVDVWARDLCTIGNAFVLEVLAEEPGQLVLRTVTTDLDEQTVALRVS